MVSMALQWIDMFQSGWSQNVTVDGCFSSKTAVTSGVPQGTVLGPLLFLLYINDLPTILDPSTRCRLFAHDCLVYRVINSIHYQLQLQKDLASLEKWSHQWSMHFNAKKCIVTTISRQKPLDKFYQLNNTILDRVSSCTYLGVPITNTLSQTEQISTRRPTLVEDFFYVGTSRAAHNNWEEQATPPWFGHSQNMKQHYGTPT